MAKNRDDANASTSPRPLCHPRFSPAVILVFSLLSSSTLVPDVLNRGSRQGRDPSFCFLSFSCLHTRAIPWRHLMAPAGVAAPRSRNLVGGEDCLSEASSAALSNSGLGQRHPKGHARAPMVLGPFAETKGPRRAGAKPRKPLPFCSCSRTIFMARCAGSLLRLRPHALSKREETDPIPLHH